MQILQKRFDLRLACPFLGEGVRSVSMLTYPLTIFNFFVIVNSGLSNVCKINSRLSGVTLLSRNLVLQDCWETGSKSCKLEVTFAIHLFEPSFAFCLHYRRRRYGLQMCNLAMLSLLGVIAKLFFQFRKGINVAQFSFC